MESTTLELGMTELGALKSYAGKVGDVFEFPDDIIAVVRSNRLSAFNAMLPREIPDKGHILNTISWEMLKATRDICPNWAIAMPDSQMTVGYKCEPIPVEWIVRQYLAGHAWREYKDGKRMICGVPMPEGMRENDAFPEPIVTPTRKSKDDEDMTLEQIVAEGICTQEECDLIVKYALDLFREGTKMAYARGLFLVDTKYEFGRRNDVVMLIDEVHTPDSSRYWYADGYDDRQRLGQAQKQLSKEFVREWLMNQGFQGRQGDVMPGMTDDHVASIRDRYIELYENIMGRTFQLAPAPATVSANVRILNAMHGYLRSEMAQ